MHNCWRELEPLRDLCKGLGCSAHRGEQGKQAGSELSKSFKPKAACKMLQKGDRVKSLQMKFNIKNHQVMRMWKKQSSV